MNSSTCVSTSNSMHMYEIVSLLLNSAVYSHIRLPKHEPLQCVPCPLRVWFYENGCGKAPPPPPPPPVPSNSWIHPCSGGLLVSDICLVCAHGDPSLKTRKGLVTNECMISWSAVLEKWTPMKLLQHDVHAR